MDQDEDDENRRDIREVSTREREVELVGGPPWGFRLGAATTATVCSPSGGENVDGTMSIVGAVKIARVNPESKASMAGLRDGDLILSVNGELIENLQLHPSTTASSSVQARGSSDSSSAPASQSPSSHEQHHKILSQLQGDRVRLCVLSKKSKNAKKIQKALAKGEFDKQQQNPQGSSSYERGPTAVQWEDGRDNGKMHSNTQANTDVQIDADNTKENERHEKNVTITPKLIKDSSENNSIIVATIPRTNEEDNERVQSQIGQEEVNNMESGPQPQGLLRQVSTNSSLNSTTPTSSIPQPFSSSLLIKQEDLQQMKNEHLNGGTSIGGVDNEEILPVWSPPGVPPSPKLGKKFRPVTFNANAMPSSPVLVNQNGIFNSQSPGGVVLSPPSLSVSNSFSSKNISNSQSSTTTTTGGSNSATSNLPRYQNPTMVLLQKAREGHLPKGAAYLQTQPPSPSAATIEPRISSSINFNLSQPAQNSNMSTTSSGFNSFPPPPPPVKNRPFKSASSAEIIDIPTTSKSTLNGEKEQRDWYKKMYESLHVEKKPTTIAKCTYPAGRIKRDPPAKSFWAKRTHSNGTMSEPEDNFEHPDEEEYDFNKFGNKVLSPGSGSGRQAPPGAIRFYNPGRIEDLNPTGGTCTSAARKQRYHRQMQPDLKRHWALSSPKSSGYESDSNYIMRKRTETDSVSGVRTPDLPPLSPAEQKHMYAEIQKGGEVPLQGLRKFVPGPGPRDPMFDDQDGFRTASPSQNIRYSESTVNIHYRLPVRIEEKEYVGEEELRKRQQQAMRAFYEEQRKQKYMKEIEDMERRRHSDNFVPSQKSPIPLNRYEDGNVIDGLVDNTPPRPGSGGLWQRMTPEPMTPSSVKNSGSGTPLAIARAKFDFIAQSPRELQLVKGDLVLIRRKIDGNWYEGELRQQTKNSYFYPNGAGTSALGIFPCTYVEILPDDPLSPATHAKYSPLNSSKPHDSEGLARVLFNFRPSHSFELDLVKGEAVILSRRVDKNWFEGRKQKTPQKTGIFPVSYVDVVKEISSSTRSRSPAVKKPIGQPVAHSLSYGTDMVDDFSLKKHHYKPNEFVLQDDSDYGEVFSPTPNKNDRNARNRRRMNQRLELITIDTRLNNDQPFRYRSIYNYKPVHPDELEIREGDIIEVLEKCDDGWYVGSNERTGVFGTFPGNYVERI
ncbi:sorbin and SH3 domain-containing protein 1 isoform X3 [Folsomia candida]|uniref:sorbin and SH3 domain-containing protein 1 isoform X3 n=1 Tax=Folsomia candida TaxID=158441 RepID=UPI000B907F2C|nr:sorbin and SH3 domain-containing protein 1 isoform X3 [Folsomia candida]